MKYLRRILDALRKKKKRNKTLEIQSVQSKTFFGFSLTKSDLNKVRRVVPLWAGFTGGKKQTVPLFLYLLHPLFKLIFQE